MKDTEQLKKIGKSNFIVVTGGVCSSIGKGVLVSSMGVLLKNAGYSISVVKWDPYLNVDPGTMSPLEHGEVFVTADGAETDLDLGHYERLMEIQLTRKSSVSSGQIFQEIIQEEREGKFLGKCIQLVPHVVNAIKDRLFEFAQEKGTDFVLVEIGGTVGDMEGTIFLEAIRQIRHDIGNDRLFHCHLSLLPYLSWSQEVKTKPTQHSVHTLKGLGLIPDSLALRTDKKVDAKTTKKLSIMCGINQEFVFPVLTHNPIYKLFLDLDEQGLGEKIQHYFGIDRVRKSDLSRWQTFIHLIEESKKELDVALVAKYVGNNEPYISVVEALMAAGYWNKVKVNLHIVEAEKLEKGTADSPDWQELMHCDGIVIPGGFDNRGIEGKIAAAHWARTNNVPYLGLCLGLQVMLIEFARSVLGYADANSTEFDKKTKHPVISRLEEQEGIEQKGATMRLGTFSSRIMKNTKAYQAYGKTIIRERHRHRYEFNNTYRNEFEKKSVIFSAISQEKNLVEIAELQNHPFMMGTQAHPEFSSTPLNPHPLFAAFIKAAMAQKKA